MRRFYREQHSICWATSQMALRRVGDAILYLLRGGLPWRLLPPYFPPVSTVRHWFYLWCDNGLWLTINYTL